MLRSISAAVASASSRRRSRAAIAGSSSEGMERPEQVKNGRILRGLCSGPQGGGTKFYRDAGVLLAGQRRRQIFDISYTKISPIKQYVTVIWYFTESSTGSKAVEKSLGENR